MDLEIGTQVEVKNISGTKVTGEIFKMLDNTVIVLCGTEKHLVKNKELEKQGYKKIKKIAVSSSSMIKKEYLHFLLVLRTNRKCID